MERTARERPGSLVAFFLLTFAAAWVGFVGVAASGGSATSRIVLVVITLAAFTPSAIAILLTARASGRAGVRALFRSIVPPEGVGAGWYGFAATYVVAVKLTVAVLHRVIAGAWPRVDFSGWYLIPFAIAFSTPFQAGEELGWRGYALPRLAARVGLGPASLALGAIWALWHLPLFFVRDADTFGQSFVVYTLEVIAISVTMAWLWWRVRGGLLPVMLLHASVNNAKDIVPSASPDATHVFGVQASLTAWLTVAVLWACALGFLAAMRGQTEPSGVP